MSSKKKSELAKYKPDTIDRMELMSQLISEEVRRDKFITPALKQRVCKKFQEQTKVAPTTVTLYWNRVQDVWTRLTDINLEVSSSMTIIDEVMQDVIEEKQHKQDKENNKEEGGKRVFYNPAQRRALIDSVKVKNDLIGKVHSYHVNQDKNEITREKILSDEQQSEKAFEFMSRDQKLEFLAEVANRNPHIRKKLKELKGKENKREAMKELNDVMNAEFKVRMIDE